MKGRLLAEARIGAELKAAQERGEVARKYDNQHTVDVRGADNHKATLPEIGIPRQRAAEMKKLAEVGEDRIRAEVKAATDEARRPSRNKLTGRIPSIAARPPELTQFVLWLRTGAALIASVGPADTLAERLSEHGMAVPINHISGVGDFLRAMEEVNAEA